LALSIEQLIDGGREESAVFWLSVESIAMMPERTVHTKHKMSKFRVFSAMLSGRVLPIIRSWSLTEYCFNSSLELSRALSCVANDATVFWSIYVLSMIVWQR
jgi:hypothetical protein